MKTYTETSISTNNPFSSQPLISANTSGMSARDVRIHAHVHLPPKLPRKYPLLETLKEKRPVYWNIPAQPNKFVGREALLKKLHQQLTEQGDKAEDGKESKEREVSKPLVISVLKGLGGIGKSELALRYIRETDYPYTLRIWFPSENLTVLKQEYFKLALGLGFIGEKEEEAIGFLKRWFKEHSGWLVVYDNVNDEGIKTLLFEGNGKIILTTRCQRWPNAYKSFKVTLMDEPEAIKLILSFLEEPKRALRRKEEAELITLVKTLGTLPLALVQAGAYIAANDISIGEYLKLYQENQTSLLQEPAVEATDKTIAITWNISLKVITKNPKTALGIDILTACAYLSSDNIPKSLLYTWMKNTHDLDELAFNTCVEILKRYSIIKLDGLFLSIHRLVQTVVRHQQMGKIRQKKRTIIKFPVLNIEWYETLLKAAHEEFSRNTHVLEDEARRTLLLPHLLVLIKHIEELHLDQNNLMYGYILGALGNMFLVQREPKIAQPYLEHALAIKRLHYDENDVVVAIALENLGSCYGVLGDAKKQKTLLEQALVIQEREFGKEHKEMVGILINLGSAHGNLGNVEKKMELLERALNIQEREFGKDHIEVAIILGNLGSAHGALGNAERAKELLERAFVIEEREYGKDHRELANTLARLGTTYGILGDAKKYKDLTERALAIQEREYGKDHRESANTLENLGNAHGHLGHHKEEGIIRACFGY